MASYSRSFGRPSLSSCFGSKQSAKSFVLGIAVCEICESQRENGIFLIPRVHPSQKTIRKHVEPQRPVLVLPVNQQRIASALVGEFLNPLGRCFGVDDPARLAAFDQVVWFVRLAFS